MTGFQIRPWFYNIGHSSSTVDMLPLSSQNNVKMESHF